MSEIANVGVHQDRSTMSWPRRIDAPVEKVWEAITLKEHLDRWMAGLEAPQMELRLGGRHFWWTGDGTVDEFEPLRVIRLGHGDGFPFMRYEVAPDGYGTLFAFTDRMNRGERAPKSDWEQTENGWRQSPDDPIAILPRADQERIGWASPQAGTALWIRSKRTSAVTLTDATTSNASARHTASGAASSDTTVSANCMTNGLPSSGVREARAGISNTPVERT